MVEHVPTKIIGQQYKIPEILCWSSGAESTLMQAHLPAKNVSRIKFLLLPSFPLHHHACSSAQMDVKNYSLVG